MSAHGRYCCKSPKLPGANFSAVKKPDRRPPVDMASITLPRSPASLSSSDEVPPHLYTKVACTAKRNFDRECKKTFATISARSGVSLRRTECAAIGGIADILRPPRNAEEHASAKAGIGSCYTAAWAESLVCIRAGFVLDFPASVQHGGGAGLTAHCPPFSAAQRTQALGLLRQRPVAKPNLVHSEIRRRCTPNPFSSNPRTSPRQKGNASERCVGVVEQLRSDETWSVAGL